MTKRQYNVFWKPSVRKIGREIYLVIVIILLKNKIKYFGQWGGDYTSEEIDEELDKDSINYLIAQELEKKGLTGFSDDIFENQEYLDKIREGKIICESIDVEEIKRRYMNNEV